MEREFVRNNVSIDDDVCNSFSNTSKNSCSAAPRGKLRYNTDLLNESNSGNSTIVSILKQNKKEKWK